MHVSCISCVHMVPQTWCCLVSVGAWDLHGLSCLAGPARRQGSSMAEVRRQTCVSSVFVRDVFILPERGSRLILIRLACSLSLVTCMPPVRSYMGLPLWWSCCLYSWSGYAITILQNIYIPFLVMLGLKAVILICRCHRPLRWLYYISVIFLRKDRHIQWDNQNFLYTFLVILVSRLIQEMRWLVNSMSLSHKYRHAVFVFLWSF